MRKIYIAGPMRGLPQYNYPAFNAAAEWLELLEWDVVNPARMSEEYGTPKEINSDPDLLAALVGDELREVENCDAIYLLRGWERSVGAKAELAVALREGLEIIVQGGGKE